MANAPHRVWIRRLAAGAEILDGQQAEPTAHALAGDSVVAILAVHRIGHRALPTGLADVQQ